MNYPVMRFDTDSVVNMTYPMMIYDTDSIVNMTYVVMRYDTLLCGKSDLSCGEV